MTKIDVHFLSLWCSIHSTTTRLFQVTVIVTMVIFLPNLSSAKEGFGDASSMPASVSAAWNSVFLFLFDGPTEYGVGTVFLIARDQNYAYFSTNYHVIKGHCEKDMTCPHVRLYQSALLENRAGDGLHFATGGSFSFENVEVFQQSENPDYAVLRAKVGTSESQVAGFPKPLKISKSTLRRGEKLYTIGFPDVNVRTCDDHSPIQNQTQIFKRWSMGIYAGRFQSDDKRDANTHIWIGTTIDAVGGNSGGPILNEAGEVVGLVQKSASQGSPGSCYRGNENVERLDWESLGVPLTQ